MGSARAVSHQFSETDPEQDARARAWAYVFDCYRKKEAAGPRQPDDPKDLRKDQDAHTHQHCT